MREINHHFATTNVINDSGQDHQCMLKPSGGRLLGSRILNGANVHIAYYLQREKKLTFTME